MTNKRIWTDEQLNEMHKSREQLTEYFTAVATDAFKSANELSGEARRRRMAFAMGIFQNLDAFVESTYEGTK